MAALTRIVICIAMWGIGAEALGGDALAVVASGVLMLLVNRAWRQQQQHEALERHRQAVIADEDLRLEVRERRSKP